MIRRSDLGPAFDSKRHQKEGQNSCIGDNQLIFWVPFFIEVFYFYFEDMGDNPGPSCNYDGDDSMTCMAVNYDRNFGRSKIVIKYKCSQVRNIKWGVGGSPF